MKRLSSNQNGFGLLAVLVLVLVIGVVGAVGYKVTQGTNAPAATVTTSAKIPAKISNTADVDAATKALDATDVDASVDPSELDNDINSLL